jgi:hypothetical protein
MDDRLRTELERLAPEPGTTLGWEEVLRRAGRIRRRRRRRAALVAVAALLLGLAGALGAAGQLDGLLSHTKEPHLVIRGDLRAGGRDAGTIEIELSSAAVVLDGHARLLPWRRPSSPGGRFRARWFLERSGGSTRGLQGALYLGRPARRLLVLCRDCAGHDSGRLDLSYEQASALVDDRVVFRLGTGGTRLASTRLVLDRTRLHRALRCSRTAQATTRCTRFYTGR